MGGGGHGHGHGGPVGADLQGHIDALWAATPHTRAYYVRLIGVFFLPFFRFQQAVKCGLLRFLNLFTARSAPFITQNLARFKGEGWEITAGITTAFCLGLTIVG
jgi:hypothetical protein